MKESMMFLCLFSFFLSTQGFAANKSKDLSSCPKAERLQNGTYELMEVKDIFFKTNSSSNVSTSFRFVSTIDGVAGCAFPWLGEDRKQISHYYLKIISTALTLNTPVTIVVKEGVLMQILLSK